MKEPILNYWYRALASEKGIELLCSDTEKARAHLYAARAKAKDPDLNCLTLTISPFDRSKLWIRRSSNGAGDA